MVIISDLTKAGFGARRQNSPRIMQRFYFHLAGDVVTPDKEGVALPNMAAAQRMAREAAAELIADRIRNGGRLDPRHRIDVTDKYGNLVFSLAFGELVNEFG